MDTLAENEDFEDGEDLFTATEQLLADELQARNAYEDFSFSQSTSQIKKSSNAALAPTTHAAYAS